MTKALVSLLCDVLLSQKDVMESLTECKKRFSISYQDTKTLFSSLRYLLFHHESLSFLLANEFPFLPFDEEYVKAYMLLGLLKAKKEIQNTEYEDLHLSIPFQRIKEVSQNGIVLPQDLKNDLVLRLSLKYEMPRICVKDLLSLYSKEKTEEILKALRKRPNRFYLARTEDEERYSSDPRLEKILLENERVLFQLKEGESLLDDDILLPVFYPYMKMLSSLFLPILSSKTLFPFESLYHTGASLSLLVEKDYKSQVVQVFSNRKDYLENRDVVKEKYHLKSYLPFLCLDDLLLSHFEKEGFDAVVVSLNDTGSGNCFLHPENLVSLSKEKIEKNRQNAVKKLNDSYMFVKKGGVLVYYSDSFLSYETKEVIHQFLLKKKSFVLEKEEFVDPGTFITTAGYYAILRRTTK